VERLSSTADSETAPAPGSFVHTTSQVGLLGTEEGRVAGSQIRTHMPNANGSKIEEIERVTKYIDRNSTERNMAEARKLRSCRLEENPVPC